MLICVHQIGTFGALNWHPCQKCNAGHAVFAYLRKPDLRFGTLRMNTHVWQHMNRCLFARWACKHQRGEQKGRRKRMGQWCRSFHGCKREVVKSVPPFRVTPNGSLFACQYDEADTMARPRKKTSEAASRPSVPTKLKIELLLCFIVLCMVVHSLGVEAPAWHTKMR